MIHGSAYAYRFKKCRCRICVEAHTKQNRQWRIANPERSRESCRRFYAIRRRNALAMKFAADVAYIAERKFASVPQRDPAVDVEDFIQEAWIAALRGVAKFDRQRNVTLRTFVSLKISRGLQDFLRTIDPLKREHRKLVKSGEATAPIFVPLNKEK